MTRRLVPLLAVALVVLSTGGTPSSARPLRPETAPASPRAIPAELPAHFALGLSAQPDDQELYGWLPDSGIPWDYAYQYLAAGVNTGFGWQTWNSNAQFPLWYAQGARANGYLPVFPYYMLLQSTGTCDSCGEAQRDLSNLNNKSLMAAYYADFTNLMKRLGPETWNGIGGFGHTAIVHVEPDLSGYAEQAVLQNSHCYGVCTGQANNPKYLKAAVRSTGKPDVAAYPNTYAGFNLALLHLRDIYAPNVLLAFHVSDWATLYDVGSSTDTSLNASALGTKAGTFAARSGTSQLRTDTSAYDLVFNDVADRDAGYYKYMLGQPNRWWDRLNLSLPNFHRWERYLSAVVQAAGKRAMVWQIPIGNQYSRTENNSDGHYQDNRVEYFLGHVQELIDGGVIGLLFGAGNGGSTVQWDGKGDGVTNPASFCSTDGMSSGQVCNDHTAQYTDDDGGYLREQATAYYASPVQL